MMSKTIIPDDVIVGGSKIVEELEALFAGEPANIDRTRHERRFGSSPVARKGGDLVLLETIRERRLKGGLRADTEFLMHLFNVGE